MSLGCAYLVISQVKGLLCGKGDTAPLASHHPPQDIPSSLCSPGSREAAGTTGRPGLERLTSLLLIPGPQGWLEALTFTVPPTLNHSQASQRGDCTDHFWTKICHCTSDISYPSDTNAPHYAEFKRVMN